MELNYNDEMGVNVNGVVWLRLNEAEYYCKMYLGEGVEIEKVFSGVDADKIKKIDFEDMKPTNSGL
jgi:hypothetical protein